MLSDMKDDDGDSNYAKGAVAINLMWQYKMDQVQVNLCPIYIRMHQS